MNYLTLEEIKYQCRIDQSFTEDDVLLLNIGDAAESFLEAHLNQALDDVAADNSGVLPPALKQAMLMFCSYAYDSDGSGDTPPLPQTYFILTAPWKRYSIA